MKEDKALLGARWDLSPLYKSINDPKLAADVRRACSIYKAFPGKYKGRLDARLEGAVRDLARAEEIEGVVGAYLYFMISRDAQNQDIQKIMSAYGERLAEAASALSFFSIELGGLPVKVYERQLGKSGFLSHNRPYLDEVRKHAKYNLAENVETMLAKLAPFGGGEWGEMMEEMETRLSFRLGRRKLGLSEVIHLMNSSHKSAERRRAMAELNRVLKESSYLDLRARALNMVIGERCVMMKERGFKTAMESRNLSNRLDAKTVNALHAAVLKYGAPQGRRYYCILKRLLKKKVLSWSDRNAPLPFESRRYIPYSECVDTVLKAYGDFSPKLASLIRETIARKRIDAPVYPGKTSGAYNSTVIGPGGKTYAFTFLNYLGTTRDVMTLAHELGHSVHGQLAGPKQGVLMADAPMAYAETASIFGEMLAFGYMMKGIGDKRERLALLLGKAGDWLNSVNRQISFSFFEQRVHEMRRSGKLTTADFNGVWLDVTRRMYGEPGDVFDYADMENLWSYVGHFMRPFYVYAYAFGELFTQSLFARRRSVDDFEKLYIEMLESGGTKDAIALMAPFGLDPTRPDFWRRGIDVSVKKWLDEAEVLMAELSL